MILKYLLACCVFVISVFGQELVVLAADSDWVDLFNGKDLNGWETWLRAHEDEGGEKGKPIGLDSDPRNVFTVKNGELRISGEVFGCISSLQQFQDYQIRFDFKWGEKKWPPRVHALRDSGFLYHCYENHGAFWNAWKRCVEYQVQEGDVGDYIPLAGPWGKTLLRAGKEKENPGLYDPEGILVKAPRTRHSGKYELPNGQWNTCQVIADGDRSVHIVNGFVINRLFDLTAWQYGKKKPLVSGCLQFQSEAAELFYRRIRIRDLPDMSSDTSLLSAMKLTQSELSVGAEAVRLSYENTGTMACHIPAIEVLGLAAGDFHFDLPEMPADIAPGEKLELSVHYHPKDKEQKSAQATLQLEGLDGPAKHTRIVLQGQL